MKKLENISRQAEKIIREAGDLVRNLCHPKVYSKEGHANFVTEADLASQRFLLDHLAPLLPQAHFFAEEQKENHLHAGFNWIIDPIDGTTNFMRGYRPCAISVGLVENGVAVMGLVYDIWSKELFSAVQGCGAFCEGERIHATQVPFENSLIVFGTSPYYRERAVATFGAVKETFLQCGDVRRSGSAAIDLCNVAAGRCDGFFESRLSPWDYCAASVILKEAGALVGGLAGQSLHYHMPMPVVAGNHEVFEKLQQIVGKYFAEVEK